MAAPGTVTINITGDASKLRGALSESESALGRFSGKMQDVGKSIMGIGTKLTLGVTAPLAAVGVKAFQMASDLNESVSKATQVFGDFSDGIMELGDRAAETLGISKQAAIEAAASFGNLFRSMGTSKSEAATLSTGLVTLAADLASFNNADPTEVLEALRSGLLGEAEPLRKFGVSLSAARIEAEALSMGLVAGEVDADKFTQTSLALEKAQIKAAEALKAHGESSLEYRDAAADVATAEGRLSEVTAGKVPELTAAQKAQAAYSIIMKDTALAQGDFARTADGAANKQRILKAQFEDAAATLGNQLLPIGQKLIGWVTQLVEKFNALTPKQQKFVLIGAAMAAAIGPAVTVIGALVTVIGALISPVGLVVLVVAALAAGAVYAYKNFETFRDVVDNVIATVQEIITGFVSLVTSVWALWGDDLLRIAIGVFTMISSQIQGIMDVISGIIKIVTGLISGDWTQVWEGIRQFTDGVWDAIVGTVRGALDVILGVVGGAFDLLRGWFEDLPGVIQSALGDGFALLLQWGRNLISGLWQGAREIWDSVVQWFRDLPGRIIGAIGDVGRILYNVGRQVIQGFIDGIKDMFGSVKNTLGGLAGSLTDWKGPPSKDARLLMPAGQLVIEGFRRGLESQYASVRTSLMGFTGSLNAGITLTPSMAGGSSVPRQPALTGSGITEEHFHIHIGDTQLTEIIRRHNRALR